MKKYDFLKRHPKIIDDYNKISEFENNDINGWAHHDLKHVNNVAESMYEILYGLGFEKEYIEEAMIAALFHDIGCIDGKKNHSYKSYIYAKKFIEENQIELVHKVELLEAIRIHSDGFDTDNPIALVLMLCDKLDIKYTRVAKAGYEAYGMRQLKYIKDIIVYIDKSLLSIKFLCDKQIDLSELESFYFMKKVRQAIDSFSKKFNLSVDLKVEFFNGNENL